MHFMLGGWACSGKSIHGLLWSNANYHYGKARLYKVLHTPPCIWLWSTFRFLMHDMHDYSILCGCVAKHYAARGVRIHPHCKILLIEFRVCSPYFDWLLGNIFPWVSWCLLVSSTELVSRKSSFVVTIVYDALWRVPTGEPIANPIWWNTYWYTGRSYVSWDTVTLILCFCGANKAQH